MSTETVYTAYYDLEKPQLSDFVSPVPLSSNFEKISTNLHRIDSSLTSIENRRKIISQTTQLNSGVDQTTIYTYDYITDETLADVFFDKVTMASLSNLDNFYIETVRVNGNGYLIAHHPVLSSPISITFSAILFK